ncbi:lantibiotic dehydratase family protein [Bacteroidota bacterium]
MTDYKCFSKYILRAPIQSLNELKTAKFSLDYFKKKPVFLQSLFLASPELYFEYNKWSISGLKDKKKERRLLHAISKYYIRSCMRCTPFGLFAGLSVGTISNDNNIVLNTNENHNAHTRLDMNYLCSLIQDLEKKEEIRDQLKYFVNSSLYEIGKKIRYVEYTYHQSKRKHQISAVENNKYLQQILKQARQGAKRQDLVNILVNNDINQEEALEYIDQLIDNQLLVSELDPTVTGDELHDFLIKKLEKIKCSDNTLDILKEVKREIHDLDKIKFGEGSYQYIEISEKLKQIKTQFDKKYLFQTDLICSAIHNNISTGIVEDVYAGLTMLNKLSVKTHETNLSKFKDAFYERFEDREVPLLLALDVETGIGYLQNNAGISGDKAPLVDDLILPYVPDKDQTQQVNWNSRQTYLLNKVVQAIKENKQEIEITDDEVKNFEENWDDLPSTLSAVTEIVKINGAYKIILSVAGGSSAINLIGRFAHADHDVLDFVLEIVKKEEALNPNEIHAEIVFLPESRVGNILSRPVFRKYEIPYLAQSAVKQEYQLRLDDLMISVKNNKIVLRSRKFNKVVKPHLSNAHNYSANSLPVYHFLADMQTQGLRRGIYFNWEFLESLSDFLPRITYGNIIFSMASWTVTSEEIKNILKLKDEDRLFQEFSDLREKRNIPDEVLLADDDNELYFNLNNKISVQIILSLVKYRPYFKLREFLFSSEEALVKDIKGKSYMNEIIFSFYKDQLNVQSI